MKSNPILNFELDRNALRCIDTDLQRPECILEERDGVVRILPDGTQEITRQTQSDYFEGATGEATRYLEGTLPRGMAFAHSGDFLIANFGTDRLDVMSRDGQSRVVAESIDPQAIGKVNFVLRNSKDPFWVTVSTRIRNRMHPLRTDFKDVYVALYQDGAFHFVADDFGFTTQVRFDASEEYLYIVETTGGCITLMRVDSKGGLSNGEVFGPQDLGKGAWPDGIACDVCGNLWGTMVCSDNLFVLTPGGDLRIPPGEGDPEKVDTPEQQFFSNHVTEDVLFATGRGVAPWMASATFGGPGLQTAYIGQLKRKRTPCFRAPAPGLAMVHWNDR